MNCNQQTLNELAKQLGEICLKKAWTCATAESCTGGGIAYTCTNIPGSSQWFERGFVTYSNEAKRDCLNIPMDVIEERGAVSEEVACAMVIGALANSVADMAIAVTGIAGPDGGSESRPVGTVFLAILLPNTTLNCHRLSLSGDREQIRMQTIEAALRTLINELNDIY